ncbi:ABC transporter ATP-binding protein [Corynebacterium sp. LaCa116]|uniref:ABC transporter ATP-binding protein n=1 Tax=Corynebacterium sp. LaCa116 TaxID=3391423 RepID=UPI00398A2BDD
MLKLSNPSVVLNSVTKSYPVSDPSLLDTFGLRRNATVDALREVSFVAERGDYVGVIGRNGSGKSTMFKLIAGSEATTSGEVLVGGEPTLLGVSAALQPQLSGVMNIKLGLLAQGMSKREAEEYWPSVAEFADLGEAVHRPMNSYSSGMGARLKFAISTSVVRDILLVDEALSTGDVAFADRAQERMDGFLDEAGTIFLVSHGTQLIEDNCNRALWLHEGSVVTEGDPKTVCKLYRDWAHRLVTGKPEEAAEFFAEAQASYFPPRIIYESQAAKFLNRNL